jgi:hypothetical protein
MRAAGAPGRILTLVLASCCCVVCHAQDPIEHHRHLMMAALQDKDVAKVKALLKTPYVDPNSAYVDPRAPEVGPIPLLTAAAGTGLAAVVQAFLDAGASVLTAPELLSPLFWAARSRSVMVRHMLLVQASGNGSEPTGEVRLFLNRRHPATGNTVLVECLAGPLPGGPLTTDYECLTDFINASVDPNLGDSDGHTPLWHASHINDERAVRILIAGGANVDVQDRWGQTVLMDTLASGRSYMLTPITKLLVENSTNLMLRDSCGLTALDHLESLPVDGVCRERDAFDDLAVDPVRIFLIEHGAERLPLPRIYHCGQC